MQGAANIWAIDATPEASFGTARTAPDKRHPFRGDKPAIQTQNLDDEDAISGTYQAGTDSVVGKKWMEFSPEFDLRLDPLTLYLRYVFGDISDPVAVGQLFRHTITPLEGDCPSFTGYWWDSKVPQGSMERYPGVKAYKLTIRGTGGGKQTFTVDMKGSGEHSAVVVATPAISAPTELPIPMAAVNTWMIGNTDYKKLITEYQIVYERAIDDNGEFAAGQTTLPDLETGIFKVSGQITVKRNETPFEGLRAAIVAQTPQKMVIGMAGLGGSSATLNIYRAFLDAAPDQGGQGKQRITIPFRGLYSADDGAKADAVIVNGTANYD